MMSVMVEVRPEDLYQSLVTVKVRPEDFHQSLVTAPSKDHIVSYGGGTT